MPQTPLPSQNGYLALIVMLWRAKWAMIAVFLILSLAGLAFVLQMDKTYTARSSVFVRFDDAYVFNPVVGGAGEGETLALEQIIQAEIGYIRTDALKTRALDRVGLELLYPDLAADYAAASPAERRGVMGDALRRIGSGLGSGAAPNTPIIDVSFTHEDPDIAALFLNALLEEYLVYRREVLLGLPTDDQAERRAELENRLETTNQALEAFLSEVEVGDFESERETLRTQAATIASDLTAADADVVQARARLRSIDEDLSRLPVEIEQYVENDATGRLLELELERQELLTRYKPDAEPVREIEQTIAGVRQFLAGGGGEGAGVRRVGPNPIRQTLEADKLSTEALISSLAERVRTLRAQQTAVRERQLRLQALAPQHQRLARQVSALEDTLNQIVSRQEESLAQRNLASDAADNVRIIERAQPPTEGESLKKIAFAAVLLVAGFFALLAGLIFGFLNPPEPVRRFAPSAPQPDPDPPAQSQPAPAPSEPVREPASPYFGRPDLPILARIRPGTA